MKVSDWLFFTYMAGYVGIGLYAVFGISGIAVWMVPWTAYMLWDSWAGRE
ncbi:hypothetical protein CHELA1G11_13025 [Hyphomicrobiales bacterium]|nr:hypothetical protein CHELA1G2_11285 [Hyphomicrobiales bacterium]CAH1668779.1 hypothetical protein CHELA1G11_13025 [Hyphomicrobiales bacterium]